MKDLEIPKIDFSKMFPTIHDFFLRSMGFSEAKSTNMKGKKKPAAGTALSGHEKKGLHEASVLKQIDALRQQWLT